MLKVQEIRELIKLIDQSSIDEFVYEVDGAKIKMKKNESSPVVSKQITEELVVGNVAPQPVPVVAEKTPVVAIVESKVEEAQREVSEDMGLHKIISPMVGTFYQAASPEAEPYVQVGSKLKENTIVCIVEAMKLFNEIEAEVNGEIVEVLVSDGQLVEYGQPLFLVKPE